MIDTIRYIAVRKSDADNTEFFLSENVGIIAEDAKMKADSTNSDTPNWALHNPVVRIARVRVTEMED